LIQSVFHLIFSFPSDDKIVHIALRKNSLKSWDFPLSTNNAAVLFVVIERSKEEADGQFYLPVIQVKVIDNWNAETGRGDRIFRE
jgi:hypothetical protein